MTTNLMWPEWVLTPEKVMPLDADPMNTSGGQSPTGIEQVFGNSPGKWRITLGDIALNTPEKERIYRVIQRRLSGRSGRIMVPAFARLTAPWPLSGGVRQFSKISAPLTDEILFSPGAAYRTGLYAPTIAAVAASDIAAGDVEGDIKVTAGDTLKAGHIFQYGENVAVITEIVDVDTGGADPVYSVKFMLPAREDIDTDDPLDFDNPRFRARLAEDDGMAWPDMQSWKFGKPSVAFVEDC